MKGEIPMSIRQPVTLKARLAQGETLIGCLVAFDAPWLVEILGHSGFDFATIDIEHEALGEPSVVNLVRAAETVGLPAIVRMPIGDRLLAYLSAGVAGVQVPDLRDRNHAEELVAFTHFYPEGRRTYYTMGRASHYGIGIDDQRWLKQANDEMLLIGMVEDIEVVARLDDILEVGGIDAFHVGPHDLAQSMGFPPAKKLDDVITNVVHKCRAAGKHVSVGVATPWNLENVAKWVEEGCRIINVGSSWVVSHSMVQINNQLRAAINSDRQPAWQPREVSRSSYLGDSKA